MRISADTSGPKIGAYQIYTDSRYLTPST